MSECAACENQRAVMKELRSEVNQLRAVIGDAAEFGRTRLLELEPQDIGMVLVDKRMGGRSTWRMPGRRTQVETIDSAWRERISHDF